MRLRSFNPTSAAPTVRFGIFSDRQKKQLEKAGYSRSERRAEEKRDNESFLQQYKQKPLVQLYETYVSCVKNYHGSNADKRKSYHKKVQILEGLIIEHLNTSKNIPLASLQPMIDRMGWRDEYSYCSGWDGLTKTKPLVPPRKMFKALVSAKVNAVAFDKQQARLADAAKPAASTEPSPYDKTGEEN